MPATETRTECGKRHYRWGEPRDRRAVSEKGWRRITMLASHSICDDWFIDTKYPAIEHIIRNAIEKANRIAVEGESARWKADAERLRERFAVLVDQWRSETRFSSSIDEKILHPAYQTIMTMGRAAVPLVLEELRDRRGHWFWALRFMTDDANPIPEEAGVNAARDSWLKWGVESGYLE